MPIRPERKHRYPDNWKEISHRIRFERAGGKCEFCGVAHGAIGYRDREGKFHTADGMEAEVLWLEGTKIIKIVLTTAHLNHDETNCSDENLAALCQKCHLNYDLDQHLQVRKANMMEIEGQLKLFEDDQ